MNASTNAPSHRFPLGAIVSTPGALEACSHEHLMRCLALHAHGDWGCTDPEDAAANDAAVQDGSRILSSYHDRPVEAVQGLRRQLPLDHHRGRPERHDVPAAERILGRFCGGATALPLCPGHAIYIDYVISQLLRDDFEPS